MAARNVPWTAPTSRQSTADAPCSAGALAAACAAQRAPRLKPLAGDITVDAERHLDARELLNSPELHRDHHDHRLCETRLRVSTAAIAMCPNAASSAPARLVVKSGCLGEYAVRVGPRADEVSLFGRGVFF